MSWGHLRADSDEVDIQVNIGNLPFELNDLEYLGQRYLFDKRHQLLIESSSRASPNDWFFCVQGILSDHPLKIYIRSQYPWILAQYLYPLAFLKLLDPGYSVMHSAAVARNGKSLALIGWNYTGKSMIMRSLVKQGFDYVGDDACLVSKGGDLFSLAGTRSKVKSFNAPIMRKLLRRLVNKKNPVSIPLAELGLGVKIAKTSRLSHVFWLRTADTGAIDLRPLEPVELARVAGGLAIRYFNHLKSYLLPYCMMTGSLSTYAKIDLEMLKIIESAFSNITGSEILIPQVAPAEEIVSVIHKALDS